MLKDKKDSTVIEKEKDRENNLKKKKRQDASVREKKRNRERNKKYGTNLEQCIKSFLKLLQQDLFMFVQVVNKFGLNIQ